MKIVALALATLLASGCMVHDHATYRDDGHAYGGAPIAGNGNGDADHQLVCHKGKKTLSLPPSAVQAHLNHGDHRGPC